MYQVLPFREIWAVDFEFMAAAGEQVSPVCLVARELRSGRLVRWWHSEMQASPTPPYATDAGSLVVAYYASAEINCHLALGWPVPERVLDLFAEFKVATGGVRPEGGYSILGALMAHGLDALAVEEKEAMRQLVMRGPPWTPQEKADILDYCQSDVDALARLLPAMVPELLTRPSSPQVALGHALMRGRYMAAAARIEHRGVPLDMDALTRLREGWEGVKARLVSEIDAGYGVYEGLSFREQRFRRYLADAGIAWPMNDNGALDLEDDTFREMARIHPQVAPLRELRHALSQLRLNDLTVGADGRNRCLLSAFASITGRNQPSNARFIFGPSVWLRGLIKPPPGHGIAYIDYSSQEFGIAAALSGDEAMQEAYHSGDVYLAFAERAGLAPAGATKATHGEIRERCKAIVLGVGYGMGADSLAARIGQPPIVARDLLRLHRQAFPTFWRWSEAAVDHAMLAGDIRTVFGWRCRVTTTTKARGLMNFPMQANGAEMIRLASCLATEAGLGICAPIHDALLLEAPLDRLDEHIAELQGHMTAASRAVLGGFELRSEAAIVRAPDRYMDKRGAMMWERVMKLVGESGG